MRFQSGSCVVCGQGTDTALGVDGEAEWHVAALQMLGIPAAEAPDVLASATGAPAGMARTGRFKMPILVCAECVSKSVFHPRLAPVLYVEGNMLPTIAQP